MTLIKNLSSWGDLFESNLKERSIRQARKSKCTAVTIRSSNEDIMLVCDFVAPNLSMRQSLCVSHNESMIFRAHGIKSFLLYDYESPVILGNTFVAKSPKTIQAISQLLKLGGGTMKSDKTIKWPIYRKKPNLSFESYNSLRDILKKYQESAAFSMGEKKDKLSGLGISRQIGKTSLILYGPSDAHVSLDISFGIYISADNLVTPHFAMPEEPIFSWLTFCNNAGKEMLKELSKFLGFPINFGN